jgi:hypothetical protein
VVDALRELEAERWRYRAALSQLCERLLELTRGPAAHQHLSLPITVPEIDASVRSLTADQVPETIRHHVGLVPAEPSAVPKGRDLGRDRRGRDRDSDEEQLAATGT